MIQKGVKAFGLAIVLFLYVLPMAAQVAADTVIKRVVVAGLQYERPSLHQFLWGRHYRKEWSTLVMVPELNVDKIGGGLKPYAPGGPMLSNTIQLRNPQGKEYILRSVDKQYDRALPEIFRNTFVENIINDNASTVHPYAALTVSPMAEAAKIYHAKPVIGFVPTQPALGEYNKYFGNNLYLLEQRPDGNWEEAANFGNAKNIISTEDLYKRLVDGGNHTIDQLSFLRARLFDMFVGDWSRHEDQWRWAEFTEGSKVVYKAIPRDRDQVYTKFGGLLLKPLRSAAGLGHIQSFEYQIKNVPEYNFTARFIDRRLLNEPTLGQWLDVAKELQQLLTDTIIINAIKELPREVLLISGNEIVDKLRARRDKLPQYAEEHYRFLAKETEIIGTNNRDLFKVQVQDTAVLVQVFSLNNPNLAEAQPHYTRTFRNNETEELRLYGIGGSDVYNIEGSKSGIKIKIIGSSEKDSIINTSSARLFLYDNPGNAIQSNKRIKLRLSQDTSVNQYLYSSESYDKRGFKPAVFFNFEDRLFVGVGYGFKNFKWRREPFANSHDVAVRYSINQKAFHYLYEGVVNQFIGNWNLLLNAGYDAIRWTNFFGIGNDVPELTDNRDFYRLRTKMGYGGLGLNRLLGKKHLVSINGFYQSIQIVNDTDRYVAKTFLPNDKELNNRKNFIGSSIGYTYSSVNDRLIPTKGLEFASAVSYTRNMEEKEKDVTRYTSELRFYIPLFKNLVFASRSAAATLNGQPEFYQLNSLGGNNSLRGFRRDRFWGKTTFFNSNELQLLFNFRSGIFNGKFGLVGLYDVGRVWHPGLESDTWHTAFGGGIISVPFNRVAASVTYAKSKNNGQIHIRFLKPLF